MAHFSLKMENFQMEKEIDIEEWNTGVLTFLFKLHK